MNRLLTAALLVFTATSTAFAADEQKADRSKEMAKRVDEIKITGANSEGTKFGKKPLLRYSDATRFIVDATVWALGDKGRPQGILVLERYEDENQIEGRSFWGYEFTVTSPKVAERLEASQFNWKPSGKGFAWTKLKSQKPSQRKTVRAIQIKQLARKFRFSEKFGGQDYTLRLMPRPLIRYEDSEKGIVDGAIFVMAHGTNAEALLILEADGKTNQWQAGFARLGAASLEAEFDSKTVWKVPFGFSSAYLAKQDHSEAALATR